MRKWALIVMAVCVALSVSVMPAVGGSIGVGANYWMALKDIDVDVPVDEDGLSQIGARTSDTRFTRDEAVTGDP